MSVCVLLQAGGSKKQQPNKKAVGTALTTRGERAGVVESIGYGCGWAGIDTEPALLLLASTTGAADAGLVRLAPIDMVD
jgi:hypothetical protein